MTVMAIPGVSVDLLSGSNQQVCYSGVGVGVQVVKDQGWQLREEGGERNENALLQDGSGLKGIEDEEVAPAGRKGHANASSEGIWGSLGSASSLIGKLVSGPVS